MAARFGGGYISVNIKTFQGGRNSFNVAARTNHLKFCMMVPAGGAAGRRPAAYSWCRRRP